MALWTAAFFIALAYSQVQADYVPADFVENQYRKEEASGESRIVSGWEAYPGQHPHHANLRMINAGGGVSGCGGSVVHRNWVVSAAHCTAQQVTLVIRAGVVSINTPKYIVETTEWYNHPTYNNNLPMVVQPNDISIIYLPYALSYSHILQPIRIQGTAEAFRDYHGEVMMASGHGHTWTNGAAPEILNWVYLRAISNTLCAMTYGSNLINANAICTQGYNVTSQSTCQGDSGGPLVYVNNNGDRILVGVASFVAGGEHGCHSEHPAGFIRPGPFLSWFEQVTGIDFENLIEEEPTEPPTTEPTTTTEAPVTEETTTTTTTTTTEAPVTEESTPEPEEDGDGDGDEDEESESEEDSDEDDGELSELLKKLEVKVKVKVKLNKYGVKKEHKHKKKITL